MSNNQRMILDLVLRNQPITRSELTERTNLTQQSVHRIVSQLDASGLLTIKPAPASGPGKPSPFVDLNSSAVHSLGLLVNTDSVVLSLVDLTCSPVGERRMALDLSSRKDALVRIGLEVDRFLSDHGIKKKNLCGIGFTIPGYFTDRHRTFNAPAPLRDWSLIDISTELTEHFGLEAYVENSATAGAIGESLNGVGRNLDSFAYLGFDYGFGGGIVINGTPLTGMNGNAGELSNIYTTPEEHSNRPALRSLLERIREGGIPIAGIEDLRQNFDPAWPGVDDWIDAVTPQLNRVVIAIHGFLDPEAIVFGGQIPTALAQMLIERVEFPTEHRYDAPWPHPKLLLGKTTGEPAATGAALKPLKENFFL
ncbi:ROK family transcriptional regulator [Primorskyibacter aestuariivivens]|nr:ROK family transcriptional regulator [Primorskyibacter aestuariivivens]MDA7430634.1 ROK family transcriptional regulator [Primorskyibacter aestuariivivens]